jgi:hypothetical protein
MVYPNAVPWEWRDRYPVKGAREAVRDLFDRLAVFDPVQDGAAPNDDFVKLPHFCFDDAAQDIFVEWCTELHTVHIANEQNPLMQQHFGKFEKLFCSIALILHLAEGSIGPVTSTSALRAAAWCEYLTGHARRIYGLVEAAKVTTARMVSRRLAEGKLDDGFTVRDMVRKQWSGVTTAMQAETALAILEENGHVQQNTQPYEVVRFNALKHGILSRYTVLSHESHADYESLVNSLMDEHLPAGATEQHLIEELASVIWRKRRVLQAEGATINKGLKESARSAKTVIPAAAPFEMGLSGENTDIRDLMDLKPADVAESQQLPGTTLMPPTRPAPSCAKVATAPMTKPCAPCFPTPASGGKTMWTTRNTPPMPRGWQPSSPSTSRPLSTSKKKSPATTTPS